MSRLRRILVSLCVLVTPTADLSNRVRHISDQVAVHAAATQAEQPFNNVGGLS
jgi:hypothetical protein